MPTNLRKWSQTATGNATVAGGANTINFAEGQNPSTVNNSAREAMAQIRGWYTASEASWIEQSNTASIASQTVFKLSGDQTTNWTAGRRWRLRGGSTTRYGSVVSSSYTAETTITVTVDSGSLSASHSIAGLSSITTDHIPNGYATSASVATALSPYVTSNSVSVAISAVAGKKAIWIDASAMRPKATNGAGFSDYDSGNVDVTLRTADFDTTTQEYAHFKMAMPEIWDEGTVTFKPYWTNTAGLTTETVVFSLAGLALGNDDALNTAFGTAQTSTDTWIAQNDVHIGPESSAITIAGTPAAGDLVVFEVSRVVASDDLTGDAKLIGLMLYVTTNAFNES